MLEDREVGCGQCELSYPVAKRRYRWAYCGFTPHPVIVANEGLLGFPTKDVSILVVTVTELAGRSEAYQHGGFCRLRSRFTGDVHI